MDAVATELPGVGITSRFVQVPANPRLRSGPPRVRSPLVEAVDGMAVLVSRFLDHFRVCHAMHSAQLRNLDFTDVPLRLPAEHAGLDGLKLAFLSDLHAGAFMRAPELERLFERVMAQEPDLVCFGGDLINTRAEELRHYDRALARLNAPLGNYAVAGNHDHRWNHDIGAWQDFLEARGVQVLANHGLRIHRGGSSLWLGGVDDLTDGQPDVAAALEGRRASEPTIVLAHQPDHFAQIAPHRVSLVLSGHTHAGQICPFGKALVAHTRYGYVEGAFEAHGSRLFVGRGAGLTILPVRWRARPQVPIVRIIARS